jgi:hypothetical protein
MAWLTNTPSCLDADVWYARASVRKVEPIDLTLSRDFDWRFPVELKPLLAHPSILALPLKARRYLSIQYFYNYMHDICLTETDVVNRTSLAIAYGKSACDFPPDIQVGAFSIAVDEAFHSYAARLFAFELEKVTGIEPVRMPECNALKDAVELTKGEFDTCLHSEIDLLATCISESTFTADVIDTLRIKACDPRFQRLMREHLADEGRHYSYFKAVLGHFAHCASARQRNAAAVITMRLLERLFRNVQGSDFDRQLLISVGIDPEHAVEIQKQTGPSRSGLLREQRANVFIRSSGLI